MSLARLVASIALGALAILLSTTLLEPPVGVLLGVIACGLVTGLLVAGVVRSAITGALAGLAGFALAYGVSGGGSLGLQVYRELLGTLGPLIPPAYYAITTATIALTVTSIKRVTLRSS